MNEPHYATTFSLIATVTERKFCFPQTFTPTWRLHYDQALEMHNPHICQTISPARMRKIPGFVIGINAPSHLMGRFLLSGNSVEPIYLVTR